MKNRSKRFWSIYAVLLTLSLFGVFLLGRTLDTRAWRPFERLTKEDVASASVYNSSGGKTAALTPAETDTLVELLRDIELYGRPVDFRAVDDSELDSDESCLNVIALQFTTGAVKEVSCGFSAFFVFDRTRGLERVSYRAERTALRPFSNFCYSMRETHFGSFLDEKLGYWVPN